MDVPQRKSLCSYLKQAKMSFPFSDFWDTREQEGCTGPVWKGCVRVNMVQIFCTLECKKEKKPVEIIPLMGGEVNKGEW
jgi:hypothetical protein